MNRREQKGSRGGKGARGAQHLSGPPAQLRRAGLYKGLLFLAGLALAGALFYTTHLLVQDVRESTRSHLSLSVEYYRNLILGDNPDLFLDAVEGIDFPLILTDSEGNPKFWKNIAVSPDDTTAAARQNVREILAEMDNANEPVPLEYYGFTDYFHFDDPAIVKLLRWFSITTTIAVAVYIVLGYVGFRSIRKAEEKSVWVGMARETAHQLGTPISSLLGWLEVLGDKGGEITPRMRQDVARLERIAIRFSKIGAQEELKPTPIPGVVESAIDYMRHRVGSGITITYNDLETGSAPIQADLISWVLENLMKNSAQAMEGEGEITVESGRVDDRVYIDVMDRGKGIAPLAQKTVFRPGYTTKKRGWGLGLSLARRVVEEMHHGRIFVKESRARELTVIRMVLPT